MIQSFTLKYLLKKKGNVKLHSSFIYNHQNPGEKNQMSINTYMDKLLVVYTCNGILLDNKKEWTWYNTMDNP